MDERLPGREYYLELRAVRGAVVETAARASALDFEEKPAELVGVLSLEKLVRTLDEALEHTDEAMSAAQMTLAVEGVVFEDGDL